jgi:hypothetical protein
VDRAHQQICRRSHQRNEHQAPASAHPSTEHLHLTALRSTREVLSIRHPPRSTGQTRRGPAVSSQPGLNVKMTQRLPWSAWVWSPPPESNRRPHPYHGTTGNRCAERRSPGHARPSGPKLWVLLRRRYALTSAMCWSSGRRRSGAGGSAGPLPAGCGRRASWNTAATAGVALATTWLNSWPRSWPGRRTTRP